MVDEGNAKWGGGDDEQEEAAGDDDDDEEEKDADGDNLVIFCEKSVRGDCVRRGGDPPACFRFRGDETGELVRARGGVGLEIDSDDKRETSKGCDEGKMSSLEVESGLKEGAKEGKGASKGGCISTFALLW